MRAGAAIGGEIGRETRAWLEKRTRCFLLIWSRESAPGPSSSTYAHFQTGTSSEEGLHHSTTLPYCYMSTSDEAIMPMVEQEEAEAEVALDSDFVFVAPHFSVGGKRPHEDGSEDGIQSMGLTAADTEILGLTDAPPAKKSRGMPGARRGKWTAAEQVRTRSIAAARRPVSVVRLSGWVS